MKFIYILIITAIILTSFVASQSTPTNSEDTFNYTDSNATVYEKGDINADGNVTLDDLYFLIDYMFSVPPGSAPDPTYLGDFNEDASTDISDLLALVDYFWELGLLPEDSEIPIIELINPDDNDEFRTNNDEKNIDFDFKVIDASQILYCKLIIDDKIYDTFTNVASNTLISTSHDLDVDENYDWKVECSDVWGNVATSDEWEFEINERDNNDDTKFITTTNEESSKKTSYASNNIPQDPIVLSPNPESKTQIPSSIPYILSIAILIVLIVMISIILLRR